MEIIKPEGLKEIKGGVGCICSNGSYFAKHSGDACGHQCSYGFTNDVANLIKALN